MINLYNLENKKFLITGGTGGIGSKIVENLLNHEKAEVFFTSSSKDKANALIQNLEVHDKKIHFGICQMESFDEITATAKKAIEKMQGIDVLICNAGTTIDGLFAMMKPENWIKVINVNLNSNYYLVSACLRKMITQKSGRIIFISSVVGSTGNIGQVNYAASKAGLDGMMRSMALEFARYNICVNSIAPGFIETEMTKKIPEDFKLQIKNKIPLGTLGQPDDIYEIVAFLSSNASRYITGQTIHVNGGMYCS